jgi:hypothetical protein
VIFEAAPAERLEDQAARSDVVDDAGAPELGDRGRSVVRGARLAVELGGRFEDLDRDAVFGEEEGEEQP